MWNVPVSRAHIPQIGVSFPSWGNETILDVSATFENHCWAQLPKLLWACKEWKPVKFQWKKIPKGQNDSGIFAKAGFKKIRDKNKPTHVNRKPNYSSSNSYHLVGFCFLSVAKNWKKVIGRNSSKFNRKWRKKNTARRKLFFAAQNCRARNKKFCFFFFLKICRQRQTKRSHFLWFRQSESRHSWSI